MMVTRILHYYYILLLLHCTVNGSHCVTLRVTVSILCTVLLLITLCVSVCVRLLLHSCLLCMPLTLHLHYLLPDCSHGMVGLTQVWNPICWALMIYATARYPWCKWVNIWKPVSGTVTALSYLSLSCFSLTSPYITQLNHKTKVGLPPPNHPPQTS